VVMMISFPGDARAAAYRKSDYLTPLNLSITVLYLF
jgi:hypothetical protein